MRRSSLLLFALLIGIVFSSCSRKEVVDLMFVDVEIHSLDSMNNVYTGMAINDGKIIYLGTSDEIVQKYRAKDLYYYKDQYLYPGFIDAHCHFYGLAQQQLQVDLKGSDSFTEVINRMKKYDSINNPEWIVGRGWDQNLWNNKEFPDNSKLNKLFPDKPVVLTRVDGHALLANTAALAKLSEHIDLTIPSDEILLIDGKLSGILFENTADKLKSIIPEVSKEEMKIALLRAQQICFSYGLTSITDAGLSPKKIDFLKELSDSNLLKINIYQMMSSSEESRQYLLDKGAHRYNNINIRSIKIYADGALGSRGALLINEYSDDHGNHGIVVTTKEEMRLICSLADSLGIQVNTHAIGDAGAKNVLDVYEEFLEPGNDKRWRIEHAQVVHPDDRARMGKLNVIPAINTTHATSDMGWAEDRLGEDRIEYAYAYKSLLAQNAWLANGSDFPIESVNPLLGYFSAVARTDEMGKPEGGWMTKESLSREEALYAMTKWAAKAEFAEMEKGSIEVGKKADLVLLDVDLEKIDIQSIPDVVVKATYLAGEKIYKVRKKN